MRIIALDIHRVFAEAVALEDGEYRRLGRIGMTRDHLVAFAATLRPTDHVVVEATGNATAVVDLLSPKVARVAVANPFQVHLIARAKTKTDKIDARVLARLYAAGFLPGVWIPDEKTLARRRHVTRRNQLVKSRVRLKAIVQSILHAHLAPRCPHADLFGGKGRAWLRAQVLPEDERMAIERHLEDHDRQTESQKTGRAGHRRSGARGCRRQTTDDDPGDRHARRRWRHGCDRADRSLSLARSPCRLSRPEPERATVRRRAGDGPAHHGRITKRGPSDARHLLVEAAWQTARSPGPMRAFYERVRARRGNHVAGAARQPCRGRGEATMSRARRGNHVAGAAVARKLAVLIWHMLRKGEDHAWGRPILMARRLRSLELAAGRPAQRGQRGSACDYTLPERRVADQALAEQAEHACRRIMQHWRQRNRRQGADAANEARH